MVNDNDEGKVTEACQALFGRHADSVLSFLANAETDYLQTEEYHDIQAFLADLTQNLNLEGQFVNSGDERTSCFAVYAPFVYSKVLPPSDATQRIMDKIIKHAQAGDDAAFVGNKKKPAMRLFEPEKTWKGHAASQLRTILANLVEGKLAYAPIMETWCAQVGFDMGDFFEAFRSSL